MRKSKYSESQIVWILKQVEGGRKVREVCREHGISEAAYYQWKSKYGGLWRPPTSGGSRNSKTSTDA